MVVWIVGWDGLVVLEAIDVSINICLSSLLYGLESSAGKLISLHTLANLMRPWICLDEVCGSFRVFLVMRSPMIR